MQFGEARGNLVASYSHNTLDGVGSFSGALSSGLVPTATPRQINVTSTIVSGTLRTDSTSESLGIWTNYSRIAATGFASGIGSIATALTGAAGSGTEANNPWRKEVAVLGSSLSSAVELDKQLKLFFVDATAVTYDAITGKATGIPFLTDSGLQSLLASLPGRTESSVTYSASDLRYTLKLNRSFNVIRPIKLDVTNPIDGQHLDLPINATATIPLKADIDIEFGHSQ